MGNQIRIGQRLIFEKHVLTSLARKMSKNVGHSAIHPRFSFSSPFSFTLGFLGAAGVFPVSFIPRFWLLASFFPWIGGRFCSAGDWVFFPHDLGAAGAFPIHDFCLILLTHSKMGAICCYCPRFPGIVVNSFESHFGHDRAKNDSGIISLFKL